jgi:hypothetical protein
MNLYEVVFWGSYGKTEGDEDTIYLVRAPDFLAAVEAVRNYASPDDHGGERGPSAHVVYEIGVSCSAPATHANATGSRVLRGPYIQCAYNYAWKAWNRKIEGAEYTKEWEEEKPYVVAQPEHPQTESDLTHERDGFQCAACGKRTSGNSYFTITARGLVDKGKTGAGRLYSAADLVKLSLWHVIDSSVGLAYEELLAEGKFTGGQANVVFCTTECIKSYLTKSMDKLLARPKQGWTGPA